MNDDQLAKLFHRLETQILQLIAKTDDPVAHRATAVALLHHKIPGVSWTGFYFIRGEDLVVEAYQGRGLGKLIMDNILARLPDCNVILYASPGKEGFYQKHGFRRMKTGMARFIESDAMQAKGFTA